MQSFLLILHVLVAVGVIGLVLLQQGRGADAGAAFGSGASGSVFGSRGPTTFLTRMTAILVAVFFLTSLSLGWLSGRSEPRRSVVDRIETTVDESAAGENATGAEASLEAPDPPATLTEESDSPQAPPAAGSEQ